MDLNKILVIDSLLSSSSSSEVDTDDDISFVKSKEDKLVRQKIREYPEIVRNYSDDEFRRNFRMNRDTYKALRNQFENSVYYNKEQTHGGSPITSSEIAILSFLWYAGNKCTMRDVAGRFGIAESTFHSLCTKVMEFLNSIAPNVINFPTTPEDKEFAAAEFQKLTGFPNVLGCIDGTYIPISTPHNKIKSTYVNRHDSPSMTLQCICRYDKLFLDVFTGVPSKIHDSRVYSLSNISKKLPGICGDKWHILGDSAYPLRKWLLTPFRDYGHFTDLEKNYNKRFSGTRVKIENSFGLLKSRWRQLIRVDLAGVLRIANFIVSCCVLHNLCIMLNDEWEEDEIHRNDDDDLLMQEYTSDQELKIQGEVKRYQISSRLPK